MTVDDHPFTPAQAIEPLLIPGYRRIQNNQSLIRLTGDGNYTRIELANETSPLVVSQNLKYFERQLPDFIRVSKSVLLNPSYVIGTTRQDSSTVYLRLVDGSLTLVSRRRMAEIINKLGKAVS